MVDNRPFPGLLCPTCRVDLVMSERQSIEIGGKHGDGRGHKGSRKGFLSELFD